MKVDATDAGSGISGVELYVDGDYRDFSRSKTSPYEFTLAAGSLALGQHRIKALVTDALGNRAWTSPVTFALKDGLPTTTIACDGGACPAGFVKGPVAVTLAGIDGGNGVSSTRYTTDGSDPDTSSPAYAGPFSLSDTTTVKFRSYDSNGNAEPVRSQTIKIDATPPTAQITSPLDGGNRLRRRDREGRRDRRGRRGQRTLSSTSTATTSTTRGRAAHRTRSPGTPGASRPGTHRLKAVAVDALGNRAATAPVTARIADTTPAGPTTTIACDGLACPTGFVKGPVAVTLAAIDGGKGVASTHYTLDGSDPDTSSSTYTDPFTLADTTTVKFRSYDGDGNAEPVRTQTIKIDATAPDGRDHRAAHGRHGLGRRQRHGRRERRRIGHLDRGALRGRRLCRFVPEQELAV